MAALLAALCFSFIAGASSARPSVILHVIVDDLGWGDVNWHANTNREHLTPNMAALAKSGIELNRMYVYHMCTPSRSSFLSGRLPVHVEVALPNPEDPNQGVPRNMTTIATKMRAGGYATHVVGKCA